MRMLHASSHLCLWKHQDTNRAGRIRTLCALLLCLFDHSIAARAQEKVEPPPASAREVSSADVTLDGERIFRLHASIGGLTPADRATIINRRLESLVKDRTLAPTGIRVRIDTTSGIPYVEHKALDRILFSVYPSDAGDRSALSLANDWAERLTEALSKVRARQEAAARVEEAKRLRRETIQGIYGLLFYTLALLPLLYLLKRLFDWQQRKMAHTEWIRHGIRIRSAEMVTAPAIRAALTQLVGYVRQLTYLIVFVVYLQRVLSGFPATRSQGDFILNAFLASVSQIGRSVVAAIPGLINIALILLLARLLLRVFDFVMTQVEQGAISLEPLVHRDLVRPTRALGRLFLILVALFLAAPNIPGAGTDVAKIVTLFLGVIVSLSSTSTLGNLLAGITIAYMRPFRIGDRVRVGDSVGDVIDCTFLHTRLRTSKNEEILLPNLQVVNSAIINYSAVPEGLILHTSVTIGYDAPRATVEALLLEAARRTEGCLTDPPPFCLITALDDFYVHYQINVYTKEASQQQQLYSRLHANIKDVFEAAHVEIMSPHYRAVRDGSEVTIPPAPGASAV